MPQYVIEFGAEQVRFIADAIKSNVPGPHQIAIDSADKEMCYADTPKSLEQITKVLVDGAATSAIIRSSDLRIR